MTRIVRHLAKNVGSDENHRLFYLRRFLNLRQASATSWEFSMAETTQIRCAPAARTSLTFSRLIPPIANQGIFTFAAAQRTYSCVTGFAPGLVPVAYTGPMAM